MNVVFDMDGTLCNIEHRLHLIQAEKKDWPAFFKLCVNDAPIWPILNLCKEMMQHHHVEVWSGRSDMVRAETEQWLATYGITVPVRMRKNGDHRDDAVVKAEWLNSLGPEDWPSITFDDRQRVVDMWRRHGIICCQVAPGNF